MKDFFIVMRKKFVQLISFAAALFIIASSLVSCGDKYDFPASTEEEADTVLTIGDYEVPFEQYRYFFMNFKAEYDGGLDSYWRTHDKDEAFAEIDALARDSLLRCYATFSLALDYDIDYKSGAVQKDVMESINNSVENTYGGLEKYLEALTAAHMNHSVYRFAMSELEVERQLFSLLKDNGDIKSDEDTVRAAIKDGEFCRAKQVLIMNDDGDDPEENRKTAENVLALAQLGSNFDKLVADYGEDPEMITNPTGYYFTHGELIEEFEDAAFALEIGELSDIVESPLGYHIILRLEPDEGYINENIASLTEAYAANRFHALVDKRAETMKISDTELWRSLSLDDFFYDN